MSGTRGGLGRIVAMGIGLGGGAAAADRGRGAGRQVRGRPVRLVRRRRRRLGRHDRWRQVPPRRLLRAAGRRRSVRRRPPEEPHPRRPGHRLRHPLRPLALGGARPEPGSPRCGGPGGTPCTTASSSGSAPSAPAAASTPSASADGTDVTPREFVAGFSSPVPAIEDRLLCARGEEQVVLARPGLVVGAAGADDHASRTTCVPAAGDRRRPARRRLAARRPERRLLGRRRRLPACASAKPRSTAPASGSPSSPAPRPRSAASGGRPRCSPAELGVGDQPRDRRRPHFSDGPHSVRHCVDRLRRQRRLHARPHGPDRQQPAGPPALPRRRRRRGLAPRRRLRPLLGQPRPGPGQPDRRRLLAAHRRRGLRQRRPVRRRPRPHAAADRSVPAAGAYSLHLWLRDEAGNEAPSSALEVPLRFDDVPPGVAFAVAADGADPRADRRRRQRRALGPGRRHDLLSPRSTSTSWTELPTKLRPEDGGRKASLAARTPDLAPGTYVFRAEARRRGRQHAPRPRCAPTAPRWRSASCRRRWRRVVAGAAQDRGLRASTADRLFARLRGGHGRGDSLTVPFGAPGAAQRPAHPGRRRRHRRPRAADRRAALARRPGAGRDGTTVDDRRARRLRAAARARPLAPGHRLLRRRRRAGGGAASLAGAAGALRRLACARRRRRCGPAQTRAAQRQGPQPRRAGPPPRQAGRDPVPGGGDPPLAPGARHPHRPRRPLPRPLPLPLRQRRRLDPPPRDGAGGGALALRARLLAPGDRPRQRDR